MTTTTCSNYARRTVGDAANCIDALFFDPSADSCAASAADGVARRDREGTSRAPPVSGTGDLLAETSSATPRTQAEAQREQASRRSAGARQVRRTSPRRRNDEPVLDYLLGGER